MLRRNMRESRVAEFIAHLLQLAYLMLPAYAANMAPPFVRFWKGWNRPIHASALGNHKTVLGFAAGVIAAVLTTGAQAAIQVPSPLLDYSQWPWLGLGFGAGAMTGDCVKSYFKRRRNIVPGRPWIPFDQLDFVIGALLAIGPFSALDLGDAVSIVVMSFIGDMAVNRLAYAIGVKTSPW
jgi:CDP-2,3-bis-(O-geranylgeranyl)-sn-glycerol synthase